MNTYYEDFLDSFVLGITDEAELKSKANTQKMVRNMLKRMELTDKDVTQITDSEQFRQIILTAKPNSVKAITNCLYALKKYFEYLVENHIVSVNTLDVIEDIDRTQLWKIAKEFPYARKYITNQEYKDTVLNIGLHEEYNPVYYQTIFMALYEGMYSDDGLSVLKNIRKQDIDLENNIAILHQDNGQECKLKISTKLAENLIELSQTFVWERANPKGLCQVEMSGVFPDSCFKKEIRSTESDTYFHVYYNRIRKIGKEYLERNVKPIDIYISGIMYRLSQRFKQYDIDIVDAFKRDNRDRKVTNIIERELFQSNYRNSVGEFREAVSGYADLFTNECSI